MVPTNFEEQSKSQSNHYHKMIENTGVHLLRNDTC